MLWSLSYISDDDDDDDDDDEDDDNVCSGHGVCLKLITWIVKLNFFQTVNCLFQ